MVFKLKLEVTSENKLLPRNYQYQLSSAIYKTLSKADASFTRFLHNYKYRRVLSGYRFFCFSYILPHGSPEVRDGYYGITSGRATLYVGIHLPEAIEHFVKGLFQDESFYIATSGKKINFRITQVEAFKPDLSVIKNERPCVKLELLSPLVVGYKEEWMKHRQYLSPTDEKFITEIKKSWIAKYKTFHSLSEQEAEIYVDQIKILVKPDRRHSCPRSHLITLQNDIEKNNIRRVVGYTGFMLEITAPKNFIHLALDAGLGIYCSQGMGFVKLPGS